MNMSRSGSSLSRTSILVAAMRAFGARDPDVGVRNPDFLAERLIGREELELIRVHPVCNALEADYETAVEDPKVAFFAGMMVLRTRFIDEALKRAVAGGAEQVVILGAGFDSRAYRFQELLRNCRVIEADAIATQTHKRQRLKDAGIEVPANVRFVPTDFAGDGIVEALKTGGFEEGKRTVYIWEGVTMYLPEKSVREMLRMIASHSAPGSSVVLDYANVAGMEAMKNFPQSMLGTAAEWGESWVFGVPEKDGRDFFRELEFDPGTPISMNDVEVMKRYAVRSDGSGYAARAFARSRATMAGQAMPPSVLGMQKVIAEQGGLYWLAELKVLEQPFAGLYDDRHR